MARGWTHAGATQVLGLVLSANAWIERHHDFPEGAHRTLNIELQVELPLDDGGDFEIEVDASVDGERGDPGSMN